jgi:hypothetical protein
MIPKSTYPVKPHKFWLRLGKLAWQSEVAIDGNWLMARSVEIRTGVKDGVNSIVIELPLLDFEIEQVPEPQEYIETMRGERIPVERAT